ncbi:endonuclease V [Sporosarcina sp. Marseille-Q4063]|uniref:endonuclease V n=1 Tax=Sporosarcina sp. Marseille-Q4063 TaxID=2810514 RepID=UPI001BAE7D07|nr:endonuclease V [Sporosarcina sp. Marseille-Q4063]QUW22541.1 endonuclease V [Sporosarcina sp. Marseille-Q4063]
MNIEKYKAIQTELSNQTSLEDRCHSIKFCAGVDVAYKEIADTEWGVCSIVVIDYATKAVVEKTSSIGKITVPYIPGYLAFRELPLVIQAANKLSIDPDLFIFDGNGYLHPRHMGIATHASFFLNKPTFGVAKNYFKIDNVDFTMPENVSGSYKDIIIRNETFGRVLRSHKDVKPIFISCGNYIDLEKTTKITLNLINKESRIPIPVRLADLETKRMRKQL